MTVNALALDLTRDVLEAEAPDELLLLDSFDPTSSYDGQTSAGPQGFGAETAIAVILPLIYKFFEKVLDRVTERTADAVFDSLKAWLSGADVEADADLATLIKHELNSLGMSEAQAEKASRAVLKTLRKKRALLTPSPDTKRG